MWERVQRAIVQAEFLPFEFMLSLFTLFSGLWILSPWFVPSGDSAQTAAAKVFGYGIVIWLIVLGAVHLFAVFRQSWPRRWRIRRFGTFSHFITYLFLGVVRALVAGPSQIIWVCVIILALTSALSYLSLSKWKPQ